MTNWVKLFIDLLFYAYVGIHNVRTLVFGQMCPVPLYWMSFCLNMYYASFYLLLILLFSSTEGLAVGVGFGAIGKTPAATFERARWGFILIFLLHLSTEPRNVHWEKILTTIMLPPKPCYFYPTTVINSNYSLHKKEPDCFSFQHRFGYIDLIVRESRWLHLDKGLLGWVVHTPDPDNYASFSAINIL